MRRLSPRAAPGQCGVLRCCFLVLAVAACESTEQPAAPPVAEGAGARPEPRTHAPVLDDETCGESQLERRVRGALAEAQAVEPTSSKVAEILVDLSVVCRDTGQLGDAIGYVERAVLVWDVSEGGDHPQLARSLVILGEMQREAGALGASERAYKRALEITEASLGADHPNVGVCVLALGGLYFQQDRLPEAEAMYRRAVEVSEHNASASSDTDIALSLRNLALVLRRQGRGDAARALLERSLAVFEQRLGSDHRVVRNLRRELERADDDDAP